MCRSRLLLLASAAMAWETCEEDIMQADRSDARFGIWAHAWGSDPAEGPVILQCAYDWAVSDSRSKPFIRLGSQGEEKGEGRKAEEVNAEKVKSRGDRVACAGRGRTGAGS